MEGVVLFSSSSCRTLRRVRVSPLFLIPWFWFWFQEQEQPEGGEGPPRLARLLTVHIPPSLTDAF